MSTLDGPYEFWDMESGDSREIQITHWIEGKIEISPRYQGAPRSKIVEAMRLHLTPESKPHVPLYWDLTSKLLIAALRPHLQGPDFRDKSFTVTKFGTGRSSRFGLIVD